MAVEEHDRTRNDELQSELSELRARERERQQVEAALHQSEARFQLLVEHAADAFFLIDEAGAVADANQRACDSLGYTREELIGMPASRFAQSRNGESIPSIAERMVPGVAQTQEGTHTRKDGSSFPVEVRIGAFEAGGQKHMVMLARDLGEHRRAEHALRESEQRLAAVLRTAMDAIVIIDGSSKITLFNEAAEKVFRCPADQAIGQPFDQFIGTAFRALVPGCLEPDASEDDEAGQRYFWVPEGLTARRSDGEEFPVEATISRVRVGDQDLRTIILRDVNERKRIEAELRQLQRERIYLQEELSSVHDCQDIVGSSSKMQAVFDDIERVALTDSTVLVTGETGTGKELVARAIHKASRRKDRVLVKVNCATLPAGLIESELFGHEKGAFTGAHTRKLGRFELADGGTIFLDEVAELSLELQTRLLRVLQEGEFERVGSSSTQKVDVRVIAATNRDIDSAVESGRFRSDLYYRLNVFPIRVPALRERTDDIPLLVRHFALKYGTQQGKKIESIPRDVMQSLQAYDWPGNVRELENIIERAVILSQGPELEVGRWLPDPGSAPRQSRVPTLEELEREHILAVLDLTGWRVRGDHGAARRLGLKPTTLEARMKKLGISRPRSTSNIS
jgi:PAS domain S-box-containing protein